MDIQIQIYSVDTSFRIFKMSPQREPCPKQLQQLSGHHSVSFGMLEDHLTLHRSRAWRCCYWGVASQPCQTVTHEYLYLYIHIYITVLKPFPLITRWYRPLAPTQRKAIVCFPFRFLVSFFLQISWVSECLARVGAYCYT